MKQISLVLMAILCAVGLATAQEPIPRGEDAPSLVNSTAVVSIDSTGQIGGDFTNGFFPNNRLDVIWVDEPQYGTVQYDSERQLVSYEPSVENLDQLDKFTVYATDDGTSWNITRFFFDPTTNELTFVTDLSASPYEGASLMGSDQTVHCSTLGTPCRDGWTRVWGGVKLIGGALETTGGVIIGVGTSWTGVGAVAGGGIAVHGADTTQAGFRQLWSGEEVRTFTSQAVSGTAHHAFGVDSEKAVFIGEIVDATAGLAGGVGTIAKAPQIVDKFGDAFVLSAKTRTVLAGGGYLDDTIDISGNVANVIKSGGTITGGINGGRGADELNQLFSKIPDEFGIAPKRITQAAQAKGDKFLRGFKTGINQQTKQIGKFTEFATDVPGRVPGSFTRWVKVVDENGRTTRLYHDTFDKTGKFIHRGIKVPGPERHVR